MNEYVFQVLNIFPLSFKPSLYHYADDVII